MTNSQATQQENAQDPTKVLDIDPAHTQAEFAVKHMMISTVRGRLSGIEGTIRWNEDDPASSHVHATLDASTVDTGEAERDDHLRSEDFLHVAEHPHLEFTSKHVEPQGDGEARIVGDLTIRGTTREVTLDVTQGGTGVDPYGNTRRGFTAETTLDRKDFGLEWNQVLETGGILVGNEVRITLDVSAIERDDA